MMVVPAGRRVIVASRPVDFRYGMDKLAALAQAWLDVGPFGGDIVVFRAKRSDRVKFWSGAARVRACSTNASRLAGSPGRRSPTARSA